MAQDHKNRQTIGDHKTSTLGNLSLSKNLKNHQAKTAKENQ
jgi:hypothetical protein